MSPVRVLAPASAGAGAPAPVTTGQTPAGCGPEDENEGAEPDGMAEWYAEIVPADPAISAPEQTRRERSAWENDRVTAAHTVPRLGWSEKIAKAAAWAVAGRLTVDADGVVRRDGRTRVARARVDLLRSGAFVRLPADGEPGPVVMTNDGAQAARLAEVYPEGLHADDRTAYQARRQAAKKPGVSSDEAKKQAHRLTFLPGGEAQQAMHRRWVREAEQWAEGMKERKAQWAEQQRRWDEEERQEQEAKERREAERRAEREQRAEAVRQEREAERRAEQERRERREREAWQGWEPPRPRSTDQHDDQDGEGHDMSGVKRITVKRITSGVWHAISRGTVYIVVEEAGQEWPWVIVAPSGDRIGHPAVINDEPFADDVRAMVRAHLNGEPVAAPGPEPDPASNVEECDHPNARVWAGVDDSGAVRSHTDCECQQSPPEPPANCGPTESDQAQQQPEPAHDAGKVAALTEMPPGMSLFNLPSTRTRDWVAIKCHRCGAGMAADLPGEYDNRADAARVAWDHYNDRHRPAEQFTDAEREQLAQIRLSKAQESILWWTRDHDVHEYHDGIFALDVSPDRADVNRKIAHGRMVGLWRGGLVDGFVVRDEDGTPVRHNFRLSEAGGRVLALLWRATKYERATGERVWEPAARDVKLTALPKRAEMKWPALEVSPVRHVVKLVNDWGNKVSAYNTGYSLSCECGWRRRLPQAQEAEATRVAWWHQERPGAAPDVESGPGTVEAWGDEGGWCRGVQAPTVPESAKPVQAPAPEPASCGGSQAEQERIRIERETAPAEAEALATDAANTLRWSVQICVTDGWCSVGSGPNKSGEEFKATWEHQGAGGWVFKTGSFYTPAANRPDGLTTGATLDEVSAFATRAHTDTDSPAGTVTTPEAEVDEPGHGSDEPQEQEVAAEPDLLLSHVHADGTILRGSVKGDGVWDLLKELQCGWSWSRKVDFLFITHSRDDIADRWKIRRTAEALRAAGWTVGVTVDNHTKRPVAEREAEKYERAEERAEKFDEWASNASARADSAWKAGHRIADGIPFGQPILVGHHSERRARRDAERIDSAMRQSIAENKKATHHAERAAAAGAYQAYRTNPARTLRRIETLQTELRRVCAAFNAPWCSLAEAPTAERRDDMTVHCDDLIETIEYWRRVIAGAEADGFKVWGPDDFTKGDFALHSGSWYQIGRKPGQKSVSVAWNLRLSPKAIMTLEDATGDDGKARTHPAHYSKITARLSAPDMARFMERGRVPSEAEAHALAAGERWQPKAAAAAVEPREGGTTDVADRLRAMLADGEQITKFPDRESDVTLACGRRYRVRMVRDKHARDTRFDFLVRTADAGTLIGKEDDWAGVLRVVRGHAAAAQEGHGTVCRHCDREWGVALGSPEQPTSCTPHTWAFCDRAALEPRVMVATTCSCGASAEMPLDGPRPACTHDGETRPGGWLVIGGYKVRPADVGTCYTDRHTVHDVPRWEAGNYVPRCAECVAEHLGADAAELPAHPHTPPADAADVAADPETAQQQEESGPTCQHCGRHINPAASAYAAECSASHWLYCNRAPQGQEQPEKEPEAEAGHAVEITAADSGGFNAHCSCNGLYSWARDRAQVEKDAHEHLAENGQVAKTPKTAAAVCPMCRSEKWDGTRCAHCHHNPTGAPAATTEPGEPAWLDGPAVVFIASENTAPTRLRVLWRVTRAEAQAICSDDRTRGERSALHWTERPGTEGEDWEFITDDGRYAPLLAELSISPARNWPEGVAEAVPASCPRCFDRSQVPGTECTACPTFNKPEPEAAPAGPSLAEIAELAEHYDRCAQFVESGPWPPAAGAQQREEFNAHFARVTETYGLTAAELTAKVAAHFEAQNQEEQAGEADEGNDDQAPAEVCATVRPALPAAPVRQELPAPHGMNYPPSGESAEPVNHRRRKGKTAHSEMGRGAVVDSEDGTTGPIAPRELCAAGHEPRPIASAPRAEPGPARLFAIGRPELLAIEAAPQRLAIATAPVTEPAVFHLGPVITPQPRTAPETLPAPEPEPATAPFPLPLLDDTEPETEAAPVTADAAAGAELMASFGELCAELNRLSAAWDAVSA
ncbi:DUF3560 domain-containing protein [Streptomyces sp. NPDC004296]|uniref:DUF3560 domain-containing protein n=1 Tax=Streptomyces sp. NPDC004296 TaxID=3364697 RepID=UPI0036A0ADEC